MKICSRAFVATLLAAGACARADDAPLFPAGTNAFEITGGYDYRITNDEVNFSQAGVGYQYFIWDNFAIVPKIRGYVADNEDDSGILGADFDLGLRWHFLQVEKLTLFAGVAGGLSFFDHDLPVGTTQFNFMAEGQLGLTYQLTDNMHFIGGANIQHFTNGGIEGSSRHDGANALGAFAGLMWTF
jgi:hypothetical protein